MKEIIVTLTGNPSFGKTTLMILIRKCLEEHKYVTKQVANHSLNVEVTT